MRTFILGRAKSAVEQTNGQAVGNVPALKTPDRWTNIGARVRNAVFVANQPATPCAELCNPRGANRSAANRYQIPSPSVRNYQVPGMVNPGTWR